MGIKKPFTAPVGVDLDNNKITNVATPTDGTDAVNRTYGINASNISTGTLAVSVGGTGASSSSAAIANLLPSQSANTGSVLTTDGSTTTWSSVGLTGIVYVSSNGNNSTADGSITKPFSTITAALNYLDANYPVTVNSGARYAVCVAPGNYNENISLTRPYTTIVGQEGKLKTTFITGTLTINPAVNTGSMFSNTFALYNLFVNGTTTLAGTIQCSLDVFNCVLYSSSDKTFVVTSTASGGNRLRFTFTDFTCVGNYIAIDISNTTNCIISDANISCASTTDATKFTGSTLTINNCLFSSSTAANMINVVSGTVNIGYSAISSSTTNGSGINIAAGATVTTNNNVYNIPTGTGAAVKGVSGSILVDGLNNYVYGTNSTISSAITVLPMTSKLQAGDISGTASINGLTIKGSGGLGYATGSGGAVTQDTSRTTGVTINKTNGSITLVSAAGSASWQSFTVTNSTVAATDVIIVNQKSGTDTYMTHVTGVSAGSFTITYATTGGTTTEQPVFNFAVIKAVTT